MWHFVCTCTRFFVSKMRCCRKLTSCTILKMKTVVYSWPSNATHIHWETFSVGFLILGSSIGFISCFWILRKDFSVFHQFYCQVLKYLVAILDYIIEFNRLWQNSNLISAINLHILAHNIYESKQPVKTLVNINNLDLQQL